jgi:hypothetical protein
MLNCMKLARTERPTPEREHAEGMLAGILAHRARLGLTGSNPYDTLDLDDPLDRCFVGSVYAAVARAGIVRLCGRSVGLANFPARSRRGTTRLTQR